MHVKQKTLDQAIAYVYFPSMTIQQFCKTEDISLHQLAKKARVTPSCLYRFLIVGKKSMMLRMPSLDKIIRVSRNKITYEAVFADMRKRRAA